MNSIVDVLYALLPAGSLGAVIGWFLNKRLRYARQAKEIHDTYKVMYEDVQKTLNDFRNENKRLYTAVTRLEKAVSCASTCPHWDNCPIRVELRKNKESDTKVRNSANRHPRARNPGTQAASDAGIEDTDENPDREPSESAI